MQLPLNQTMHLFPSHSPDLKILQFIGIVNVHGLDLLIGKHEETVHVWSTVQLFSDVSRYPSMLSTIVSYALSSVSPRSLTWR